MQRLGSSSGLSLVETLMSIGLFAVVIMAMMSIETFQLKQSEGISQKLDALDMELTLVRALADGSVCQYVLNNPSNPSSPFTFNYAALASPDTVSIDLPESVPLYASANNGVAGPVLVQINQPISKLASSLVVKSIQLIVSSCVASSCRGFWQISFDNTKLIRPIHPLTISTIFLVDNSAPANTRIVKCQTGGKAAKPPICLSPNSLHFNGSVWTCDA